MGLGAAAVFGTVSLFIIDFPAIPEELWIMMLYRVNNNHSSEEQCLHRNYI